MYSVQCVHKHIHSPRVYISAYLKYCRVHTGPLSATIHHFFFKALKYLKNSDFSVRVLYMSLNFLFWAKISTEQFCCEYYFTDYCVCDIPSFAIVKITINKDKTVLENY